MSDSDSDHASSLRLSGRKTITSTNNRPLFNLVHKSKWESPLLKKKKKKQPSRWGDSSSDSDYESGNITSDYGSDHDEPDTEAAKTAHWHDDGSATEKEKKAESKEDIEAALDSPPGTVVKLFRSAKKMLGIDKPTPKKDEEIATNAAAEKNLTAAFATAAKFRTPEKKNLFAAHPVAGLPSASGSLAASSSSSSPSIAFPAFALSAASSYPSPRVATPIKSSSAVARIANIDVRKEKGEKKIAAIENEIKLLDQDLKEKEDLAKKAQAAYDATLATKTPTAVRIPVVLSATVQLKKASNIVDEQRSLLAKAMEKLNNEKGKQEARELDPSIQTDTEAETDSEVDLIKVWDNNISELYPVRLLREVASRDPVRIDTMKMSHDEFYAFYDVKKLQTDFKETLNKAFNDAKLDIKLAPGMIKRAQDIWNKTFETAYAEYTNLYDVVSRKAAGATKLLSFKAEDKSERRREREERKAAKAAREEHKASLTHEELLKYQNKPQSSGSESVSEDSSYDEPQVEVILHDIEEEEQVDDANKKARLKKDHSYLDPQDIKKESTEELSKLSLSLIKDTKMTPATALVLMRAFKAQLEKENEKSKSGMLYANLAGGKGKGGWNIGATGKITRSGKNGSIRTISRRIDVVMADLEDKMKGKK